MKTIAWHLIVFLSMACANLAQAATTNYSVTLTFIDDTTFRGTFDYDPVTKKVSNLKGQLDDVLMGNIESLDYQTNYFSDGRGGITAHVFAMNTEYIGTNPPVNNNVGVAINFNASNPTLGPTNTSELAYMDCSPLALMGKTCMYYLSWHNPIVPMEGGHGVLSEKITSNGSSGGGNGNNETARYDCLFNWAEINYAHLFLPAGAASQTEQPYYYRHYPSTRSYVGVSLVDGYLYYLGPTGVLEKVGPASDWLTNVGC